MEISGFSENNLCSEMFNKARKGMKVKFQNRTNKSCRQRRNWKGGKLCKQK